MNCFVGAERGGGDSGLGDPVEDVVVDETYWRGMSCGATSRLRGHRELAG
jgi:hypothetical protein